MSRPPNNTGNNPNPNAFNPYRNLGTYSSLGDSISRPPLPPQNQRPLTNFYSSLGDGPTHPRPGERRGSNYSVASNNHYEQQGVTWVVEGNYGYGQNGSRGEQIPVTWNVEQWNEQSNYHRYPQQSQQQRQNSYGQQQQPMNMSQQMQYQQPSNSYANVSYANNAYQSTEGQFPAASNNGMSNMNYMPAIPPPPPPPPVADALPGHSRQLDEPAKLPPPKQPAKEPTFNQTAFQAPPKQAAKQAVQQPVKQPSPPPQPVKQPPAPPVKKPPAQPTKQKQPSETEKKKVQEPSKQKRSRDDTTQNQDKSLRWKPPAKKQAVETKPAPSIAWQPPKKSAESKPSAASKQLKPSNPAKSASNQPPPETKKVDANVSAINALSALESKWSAPPSKPPEQRKRKRGGRKRKKKKDKATPTTSTIASATASDAVGLIGNWVDLTGEKQEDKSLEEGEMVVVGNGKSDNKVGGKSENAGDTNSQVIDLTGDDGFLPLSQGQQKEVEQNAPQQNESQQKNTKPHQEQKDAEPNQTIAAVSTYTDIPLDQMSKSQLASYADVLSRAIDVNKAAVAEGVQQPPLVQSIKSSSGDEMEISDEEEEVEFSVKLAPAVPSGDMKLAPAVTSDGMKVASAVPSDMPEKSHETSSDASRTDSTASVQLDTALTPSTGEKPPKPDDEKEKYRLRLEELRAKKKLANAKLRLAKQKQMKHVSSTEAVNKEFKRALSNGAVNDARVQNSSATKMARPLSNHLIPDVTALQMLDSLVFNVNLITEPRDKVRFVESVYQDSSDDESEVSADITQDPLTPAEESKPAASNKPAAADVKASRKATESLKQKLHLAKLKLELKKKELALKKKRSSATVTAAPENASKIDEAAFQAALSAEEACLTHQPHDHIEALNVTNGPQNNLTHFKNEQGGDPVAVPESNGNVTSVSSDEQKAAQIEELKRRQKELKQSNEVSNLKNLVQRQRELLNVKSLELSESSTQLQSCISEIKSKQEQLAESEKRLEEMNHRKRIMEGMILRATDKLMTARRNLREATSGGP